MSLFALIASTLLLALFGWEVGYRFRHVRRGCPRCNDPAGGVNHRMRHHLAERGKP